MQVQYYVPIIVRNGGNRMSKYKRPSQTRAIKRFNWKKDKLSFTDRVRMALTNFPTLDVPKNWGKDEAHEEKNNG